MPHPFEKNKLSPELAKMAGEISEIAQGYGLTYFPIKFVEVTPKELNAVAAYTGFPIRMPHWKFGMDYEDIHKRYTYGMSKIYEMVINTNPVIAYLLNTNALVEQKLVMIHVCGHADFFYNNAWFKKTDRMMLDQMANNASRVRRIMDRHGEARVEAFLDCCFSLNNLIDPYRDHIKRKYERDPDAEEEAIPVPKLRSNQYMDRYINTQDFIKAQKRKLAEEKQRRQHFPESPDRDILGFLVKHAPKMHQWQRDILSMVREEAYYFAPQRMTKIMNEGWATKIHSKFMTEVLADHSEIIDYCDSQSRAIAQGRSINPYRLGLSLYKSIEDRWNKGQFGPEWDACDDLEKRKNWDRKLNLGKEKIFQVRASHNDLTFIDDFLTEEFCREEEMFRWKPNEFGYNELSRKYREIKDHFLQMLANGGSPVIQITNANYENRGEILMEHVFDGQELDKPKAKDTLENMFKIWTRPIHIDTIEQDEDGTQHNVLWSFNGKVHSKTKLQ